MNFPKVLHLINGKQILGAEQVVIQLVRHLPAMGYLPSIGVINGDDSLCNTLTQLLDGHPIQIHKFSGKGSTASVALRLLRFCREQSIDIIHSHGYKSDIISLITIFSNRKIFLIATNHIYKLNTWRESLYRTIDLLVLSFFDRLIAVSNPAKEDMISGGLRHSPIYVIDNGVTEIPFDQAKITEFRKLTGCQGSELLFGIVASLTPEKAHSDLLHALLNLNTIKWRLAIIGDGPLRFQLEEEARHLGISAQVYFTGHLPTAQDVLPALDVFILSSHLEGLPMALLEAMQSKVPVVAPAIGGIPTVIQDEYNGFLFTPGNTHRLSQILLLLANDASIRSRIAEAGQRTIRTKYSSLRMAEEYVQIYDQLGIVRS